MKDPPTRKTKKSHGTPSKGDSQPPHGELRPTFYNPFEVKHRQKITKSQYKILEKSFTNNHMPNGDTRQQLATQLSMTPRTIQVWFQNRRAKSKVSTAVTDHSTKSDTPSSSDMSNMEMGDSATEYLDRQEHDTPMFMQELFSQGSEPDLDDALDINVIRSDALSPEYFSGSAHDTAHPSAPVQGDTMAISSPWDLHEHWDSVATRESHVPDACSLVGQTAHFFSSSSGDTLSSSPKLEEAWPAGVILDREEAMTRPITRSISFQLPDLQEPARPRSSLHLMRRMSMPASIGRIFDMDDASAEIDQGSTQSFKSLFTRDLSATRTHSLDNFGCIQTSYPQTMSKNESQEDVAIYHLQQQLEEQLHVQQMPNPEDLSQLPYPQFPQPRQHDPGHWHIAEAHSQQAHLRPSHFPMQVQDPLIHHVNTGVNIQNNLENQIKKGDTHLRAHGSEPGPRHSISEPYQLPQLQTPRILAQLQHQLEHQSWKRTRIHNIARSRLSLPVTLNHNNSRRYSEPGNFLVGLTIPPDAMYSRPGYSSDVTGCILSESSSMLPPGAQLSPQQDPALGTIDYGKDTLSKMRALSNMFQKAPPPLDTSMSSYTPAIGTPSSGSTTFEGVDPATPSTMSSSPTSSISPSSSMTPSPFSDLDKSQALAFATYSPSSSKQDGFSQEAMTFPSSIVALNATVDRGSFESAPLLMRGHSLDSLTWQPTDQQKSPPFLSTSAPSRRHSQILSSPTSPHPLQQQHLQQQYQLQQHQLNIQQAQYQQFIQDQHLSQRGQSTSQLFAHPNLTPQTQGFPFAQNALGIHPLDQPNWPLSVFDNRLQPPSSASTEQIQLDTNIPISTLEQHVRNGDHEYSLGQHFPDGHFDPPTRQQRQRQQPSTQPQPQPQTPQQPQIVQHKQVSQLSPSPVSFQTTQLSNRALPPPPSQPPPVRQRKQPTKRLHRSHSISVTPSAPYHHSPTSNEIEAYKHEAFVREHQRQQRESEQQRRQM